jgi:hypothetical protein
LPVELPVSSIHVPARLGWSAAKAIAAAKPAIRQTDCNRIFISPADEYATGLPF